MKLTTRAMRVAVASVAVVGVTGLSTAALAGPAGTIADDGVVDDDPGTVGTDEGAAIDCDNINGAASSLKTDAGSGYGYTVSTLNVAGIKWLSGGTCTTVQPNVAAGTATAVGNITKISGKLQTPKADCTSDTVEGIVNGFGAGKTIGGDEYPASGKLTVTYTNIDSNSGKTFSSQVYARTTQGVSMVGDTLALTGIVIKGAALGGVYTSEMGFLPTKVTDDVTKGGNGNGYDDTNFQKQYLAWLATGPSSPPTAYIQTGMKIDTDLNGTRDTLYDKDGDGFAGDSTVGATELAGGLPENLVSDSCIRYVNMGGTPGTSLPGGGGGGNPTVTGGMNLPMGAGDAIQAVSFFTDGTTAGGIPLNSSMHISFQP